MNLLAVVNQIINQTGEENASQEQLLGLPSALVGVDLDEIKAELEAHRLSMEKALGKPVHQATAFLDLYAQDSQNDEIDDFCVLKKEAMQDLMQAEIYDRLTGLYSRNIMDNRLHEEFRRARRYKLPLSALFIDIDDFKAINDNYGHSEGDRSLSFIGRFILDRLRDVDIPIRYGGEEFVIVLPHTDGETALALAAQLHDGVGEAQQKAGLASTVTISIGVGTLIEEMKIDTELIDAADKAVYRAKRKKNRVWPGLNGVDVTAEVESE
jgi:diguanylate cyclase (GGDEF)-like protein